MRKLLLVVAVALIGCAATARSQSWHDYTAPRNASLDAAGVTRVTVDARAGVLRISGRAGATTVTVHGTAIASRESWLDDIQLVAERHGDAIEIRVDMPQHSGISFGRTNQALDLVIEVPRGMAMRVDDTSGDLEIHDVGALDLDDSSGDIDVSNTSGTLRVHDSSGSMKLTDIGGDVEIEDGSGEIEVRRVTGTVHVIQDSSGGIDASDVSGSVVVDRDGSGGINVEHVGGDFTVGRAGSGGINYDDVKGAIHIPRHR
jgi:hypothetical protein